MISNKSLSVLNHYVIFTLQHPLKERQNSCIFCFQLLVGLGLFAFSRSFFLDLRFKKQMKEEQEQW